MRATEVRDKIVEAGDPKILDLSDATIKYSLIDHGAALRSTNVTLRVYYDTMPLTAQMYMDSSEATTSFVMPDEYFGRSR